jgi:Spy/CpxP family protein refolding chaperone
MSMRKLLLLSAAMVSAAAFTLPAMADSPVSASSSQAPHHYGTCHRPAMARGLHLLHRLNLSDAQKSQIHALFAAERTTMKAQFASLHQQRLAFERAVPGTAEFQTAESALEQAEAASVPARIQSEADLRTKIYALLTDAQKSQLATLIAQQSSNDIQAGAGT